MPTSSKERRPRSGRGECDIKNRTLFTGDNLYVLRGFRDRCIDLIYLDPPFKSDHNYAAPIGSKAAGAAFKDTWTLSDIDEAWIGEIADINDSLYKVLEMTRAVAGNSMLSYMLYMSIRTIELHRILKDTGSLYLHCDSTAVHYLKTALDAIFGRKMFVNEIVWKRFNTHNDGAKKFGNISDMILCYAKTKDYTFNREYLPYNDDYVKSQFRHSDERGRYKVADLTAESLKGGGVSVLVPWARTRMEAPPRLHDGTGAQRDGAPSKKEGRHTGIQDLPRRRERRAVPEHVDGHRAGKGL